MKAERLRALCRWYLERGAHDGLSEMDTATLRRALLGVHGVGPETADDILLYAFERPVFVVDAYTRRLCDRLGLLPADLKYAEMQARFAAALPADADLFNEYHALIVRQAATLCRARPRCAACFLRETCQHARRSTSTSSTTEEIP